MNKFQYYLHESEAKKEKSSLEKTFEELINKVGFYEKQYAITLKLYKSEWEKEIKKLTKKREVALHKSKKTYDKTFKETEDEDKEFRHSYADHISGLTELEIYFDQEIENTNNIFKDFFDLYNKSLLVTLYSLTESTLKELCEVASMEFSKKIKYKHLDSREYLKASINYFELVVEIPRTSLEKYISKLSDVQSIRNWAQLRFVPAI